MEVKDIEVKDRIIVGVGEYNLRESELLIKELRPYVGGFRIGAEFFASMLVEMVNPEFEEAICNLKRIRELFGLMKGKFIICDTRINGTPETVSNIIPSLSNLSAVKAITINPAAGKDAIAMAATIRQHLSMSVLGAISLPDDEPECVSIYGGPSNEKIIQFARILNKAGIDGIICSASHLGAVNYAESSAKFIKIVEGFGPNTISPVEAVKNGASWVVLDGPIICTPKNISDLITAVKAVGEEIAINMR